MRGKKTNSFRNFTGAREALEAASRAPIAAAYWTPDGVLIVHLDKTQRLYPSTPAMQTIAAEHLAWTKRAQKAMDAAKPQDAAA